MVVEGDYLQNARLRQEEQYRVRTEFQQLERLDPWTVWLWGPLAHPGRHLAGSS